MAPATSIDQANIGTRSRLIPGARRARTVATRHTAPRSRATRTTTKATTQRSTPSALPPPGPPLMA